LSSHVPRASGESGRVVRHRGGVFPADTSRLTIFAKSATVTNSRADIPVFLSRAYPGCAGAGGQPPPPRARSAASLIENGFGGGVGGVGGGAGGVGGCVGGVARGAGGFGFGGCGGYDGGRRGGFGGFQFCFLFFFQVCSPSI